MSKRGQQSVQVEVRLYGLLREYYSYPGQPAHHPFPVVIPEGTSVAALAEMLQVPLDLVAGIAVNGETAVPETHLHERDQVRLFPPSTGG